MTAPFAAVASVERRAVALVCVSSRLLFLVSATTSVVSGLGVRSSVAGTVLAGVVAAVNDAYALAHPCANLAYLPHLQHRRRLHSRSFKSPWPASRPNLLQTNRCHCRTCVYASGEGFRRG